MKLNSLYSRREIKLLKEDQWQDPRKLAPSVPATRFRRPDPGKEVVAKFKPAVDFDAIIDQADQLLEDGNCPKAYKLLKTELQKNYMSGLRQHPMIDKEGQDYFFIAGDVDNMKWLNDESGLGHDGVNVVLQTLGKYIMNNLEAQYDVDLDDAKLANQGEPLSKTPKSGIDKAKFYHPHGDEFQGHVNISHLKEPKYRGVILLRLIKGLMDTSEDMASSTFYRNEESKGDPEQAVRATVSFAVSSSKRNADLILTKTKQQIKYVVVIDQSLIKKYIYPYKELRRQLDALSKSIQGATLAFNEDKNKALEAVMNRPGCLLLELNPLEIPRSETLELENQLAEKREYLQRPGGVCPIKSGSRMYFMPLKEPYNGFGY